MHCERAENQNIDKTREPIRLHYIKDGHALKPTRCFLFFAHRTTCPDLSGLPKPHTNHRYSQSFVNECNLTNMQ